MRYKTTILLIFVSTFVNAQRLQIGIEKFENEKYDEAAKTFNSFKSANTDYAEARYYLGRIAIEKRKYKDARSNFKEAIKENENVSKYHKYYGVALGNLMADAGQLRQAMLAPKMKSAFKRAAELNPTDEEAQKALVNFYSQAPGILGGSWEKAFEAADALYKISPREGQMARATIYERKEDYDLAEQEYIKVINKYKVFYYEFGMFYQARKDYDKSYEILENGLLENPENWAILYQIGKNSALSGLRADRGIECLSIYLEEDRGKDLPSRSSAKSRIGMIYEKQGHISKAKSLYQEALNENPKESLAKTGLKRIKQ